MLLQQSPFILYSDGEGNIFEDISLYATGRSGWDALAVPLDEWIDLPDGGNLYELPGRRGIGIDVQTGEMRLCEKRLGSCRIYSSSAYWLIHGSL